MGKTKTLLKTLILGLFSTVLIFSSCEIGLGSSVDTQVPEISIDSPESGVVIRDSFTLRGKWSDDGTIKGVTVTLNSISSDNKLTAVITKAGVIKSEESQNSWFCTINPVEEGVKDGNYEASIVITDMAEHSTTVTRQITLDNTAPVVVLQRPSTGLGVQAEEMDSYGQSFTIEGQAADDSSISHIDVKIYADAELTQLLDTVRLNNVPPTISLDVAKWGDEHYAKIYGSTEKEGTKTFWCEIEAYDSAQRYPEDGSNQSAEDTDGNCEKSYYLYEEIATSVLADYKITDLYKIKSGTFEGSEARSAGTAADLLKGKEKKGGSFSLNPDNSPTFRVISGGLEALDRNAFAGNFTGGKNSVTNGGEIAVEVNPGLDNIPLKSGMKVYAYESDENGNITGEKLYPKDAGKAVKSGTKYTITPVFSQVTESDGSGGFKFNKTYILGVEGSDESGNGIIAKEGLYGFKFTTSGAGPALKVDEPDDGEHYIAKGGKVRVSGSVSVEAGVADLELIVYKAGDAANAVILAADSKESAVHKLYKSTDEDATNEFEYEIDCAEEPFNQNVSGNYIIKVRASQGKSSEVTRSVSYDVKAPKVKRISAEPLVAKTTDAEGKVSGKVNGKLYLSGEMSDDKSGFASGSWKIYKNGDFSNVIAEGECPEDFSDTNRIEIDTTQVESGTSETAQMTVRFTVSDEAGNSGEIDYTYTVDQKTDIPELSGNTALSLSLNYDELRGELEKEASERKNVFTKGGQLIIGLKDDDGIGSITVRTAKNKAENEGTENFEEAANTESEPENIIEKTYTFSDGPLSTTQPHDLPRESGSYKVTLTVSDNVGTLPTSVNSVTFYVQVTGNAPDAQVKGSPEWITTNAESGLDAISNGLRKTEYSVTVNVLDGTPRASAPRYIVKRKGSEGEADVQLEEYAGDTSGKTYKESFKPAAGSGSGSVEYVVIDRFNNEKKLPYDYRVDNGKPAVKFAAGEIGIQSTSYTFSGEAEDELSGIGRVDISFDGGASWKSASGNTGWNYTAVFGDAEGGLNLNEGEVTVKVRAVDNVGNIGDKTAEGAVAEKSFIYDKAAPEITELKYKRETDTEYNAAGSGFESGKSYSIKGKATDSRGIAKVEIYENGEKVKTIEPGNGDNKKDFEWTADDLPFARGAGGVIETGTYNYIVKATDLSGRVSEAKTFKVAIDKDGPVVTISGPAEGDNLTDSGYAFSGDVTDGGGEAAVGVKRLWYAVTKADEGEPAEDSEKWIKIEKETGDATKVNWKSESYALIEGHDLSGLSGEQLKVTLEEGSYKLWVKAEDKAGNWSDEVKSASFTSDKAKPVLSWSAEALGEGYLNRKSLTGGKRELKVKGSAADSNGLKKNVSGKEYVKYSLNGGAEEELTVNSGIWEKVYEYGENADSTKKLIDGKYKFVITAEDLSGRADRKSETEREWIIDTSAPVISGVKAGGNTLEDDSWYKSRTISVELTAEDAESEGSGISMVEYNSTRSTGNTDIPDSTKWNALTKNTLENGDIVYKGPVEFSETGAGGKLWIRATDKAGNVTYWSKDGNTEELPAAGSAITVNIDESEPELDKTKFVVEGMAESEEDTIYLNGSKKLTIYGSYTDADSGVGELRLYYQDGNEVESEVKYAASEGVGSGTYSAYSSFNTFAKKKSIAGWKAEIGKDELKKLKNKTNGKSRLIVKGVNGAGSEKVLTAYSLVWDETKPVISGITLKYTQSEIADPADASTEAAAEESAAAEGAEGVYKSGSGDYFMNPEGRYLIVKGSAADTNGLSDVRITAGGKNGSISGSSSTISSLSNATNESWSFKNIVLSGNDGEELSVTVSAEDKAGNVKEEEIKVVVDKTAPSGIHLIDKSGKDLFFRIGAQNRDDGVKEDDEGNVTVIAANEDTGSTATNSPAWSEIYDKDVGGKYSGGTFGNAQTIKIRGAFTDVTAASTNLTATDSASPVKGSGVRMIYYDVMKNAPEASTASELKSLAETVKGKNQTISPKTETKRIFFSADSNELSGQNSNNITADSIESRTVTVKAEASNKIHIYNKKKSKYTDKYWVNVESTFSETIGGFEAGENYLVLVAEDNAGNYAVDYVTIGSEGHNNFSINVDTDVPVIVSDDKYNETAYTNLKDNVVITGKATDTSAIANAAAGVSSIVIEVNGRVISEDRTDYGTISLTQEGGSWSVYNTKWTATIKPEAFKDDEGNVNVSGNITVYATVKDAAGSGNSQKVSVATLNVDTTPPAVSITEPADADSSSEGIQINRKITIEGSASDKNGLHAEESGEKTLKLYYTTKTTDTEAVPESIETGDDAATAWKLAGNAEHESSWSIEEFDTESLGVTDGTTVYLLAAAKDKAGNEGYSKPVAVVVDQNSDRPKITLNSIDDISGMTSAEAGRVWLKYSNKLNGKIEDDDGIKDKKFWYSKDNGAVWTEVSVGNGGSWSIDLTDGSYSIMFKVTDSAGKEFITNKADTLDKPKLCDADGHTKDIELNLGVDKTSPLYDNLKYDYFDSTAASGNGAYTANWVSEPPLAGGNRTKYAIQLRAGDENKIESVKLKIGNEDPVDGTATTSELSEPGSGDDGKYYRTWEIKDIDVSKATRGETDVVLDAKLLITDKAGLVKEDTVRIHVDNEAPVIGFTEPKDTKTSCGDIVVQGTASGTPVKMQYAVSADGAENHSPDQITSVTVWNGENSSGTAITNHALINTTNNAQTDYGTGGSHDILGFGTSWQLTFDGQASTTMATHGKKLNEILSDFGIATAAQLSATTNAFDDIVYLYVWIKSEDEVGNISRKSHKIKLDPQGDRPVIDFSYPETDGAKMGGKVKIYGTATDPDGTNLGIDSVWLQIKADAATFSAMTKTDLDFMASNGYDVYNIRTYDPESNSNKKWGEEADRSPTTGCAPVRDEEGNPLIENGVIKYYTWSDYAALASSSGASWNIEINRNLNTTTNKRELDPAEGVSTKKSALRVYARDKDGKFSVGADKTVEFDADKPVISGLRVVQKNGSGTVTAARQCISDMYVKGEWYLDGKVTDKDNIGNLTLTINGTEHKLIENSAVSAGYTAYATRTAGNPDANIDGEATFTYPLGSGSGVGKLTVKIEAEDAVQDGEKNKQDESLVIFYDNQSPDVQIPLTTGIAAGESTITVKQSDGWYSFGSTASEPAVNSINQSGFAYTAFYFKRSYTIGSVTTTKLYDVLRARTLAEIDISSLLPSGLTYSDPADGGDGLYWYHKTAGRNENALDVLTISGASAAENASDAEKKATIRPNSLVKIGGALYLVTAVSGDSVTINGYPDASFTDVYVALAGIVDHTVTEAAPTGTNVTVEDDGYYAAPQFDDGDRMIESVNKNGSDWRWNTSICSKNIPDGPVELVYTVFDNAGNYTVKTVSGTVDNNRPRIAGVTIKTDYNGDDKFDGTGEVIDTWASSSYADDYYTGTTGTPAVRVYDPDKNSHNLHMKKELLSTFSQGAADEPKAVLKGRTQIVPEIVGGNGAIYYSYDIGKNQTGDQYVMRGVNTTKPLITEGSIDYTAKSGTIDIQVGDLLLAGDTDDENTARNFSFVLYDSTEGSYWNSSLTPDNARINANKATIDLWFAVRAADSSDPVVTIKPFYWNGLNDNSIYNSASAESYENLAGHIELTPELDFEGSTFSENGTGIMDMDPKVSGKIVLEGSVHDAKRLYDIKANIFSDTEVTLADIPDGSADGKLVSKTVNNFGTAGYYFEIVTQSLGESGHDISWKLYVDTEVVGISGADKNITITAHNFGVPSPADGTTYTSINGTTKYGALEYPNKKSHAPYSQMDIVPYVQKVRTSLSSIEEDNPSVYARTALGHYPVYMTHAQGNGGYTYESDIGLKGFNLSGGTVMFDSGIASTALKEKDASNTDQNYVKTAVLSADKDSDGYYTFTLPNGAKSGTVTVSVGSGDTLASTLNNFNNDDGHGSDDADSTAGYQVTGTIPLEGDASKYKNFYNRIPNGTNNNRLTDDLYFDVWEVNSEAARAYNDGKADNAVMDISPASGMIGFAFSNGSERFSMGGTVDSTEYSYRQWNMTFDYMDNNHFVYDSTGHSYGTTSGGDVSDAPNWDFYSFMSDRWGRVGEYSGSNKNNSGGGNPDAVSGDWNGRRSSHMVRTEGIGQYGSVNNPNQSENGDKNSDYKVKKNRIQSTSIATLRHGNSTYIYLAYYDLINQEIRFRFCDLANGVAPRDKNDNSTDGLDSSGSFVDLYCLGNGQSGKKNYAATAATGQIVATNTVVAETDTTNPAFPYRQSLTLGSAGNAVAIGVNSDNVVVMVWHDGKNNLKISYNVTPQVLHTGATSAGWTPAETLISGAGEYCQLKVDVDGNVHVAAYDNKKGDLKYAYVPYKTEAGKKVPDISKKKTCIVDSYLETGYRISLDVAKEGTRNIPHIGFWAAYPEKPRYAYLKDIEKFLSTETNDAEKQNGVSETNKNKYTGIWECGIVPTRSEVREGKVNVGVWKKNGQRVDSNAEGFKAHDFTLTSNYSSEKSSAENDRGYCYGNGTKNAVLGYVVMQSSSTYHVETAQKR